MLQLHTTSLLGACVAATATVMMVVVPMSTTAFCLGLQVVIDHMSKVPAHEHCHYFDWRHVPFKAKTCA
jgi:hypothetical protein